MFGREIAGLARALQCVVARVDMMEYLWTAMSFPYTRVISDRPMIADHTGERSPVIDDGLQS